MRQFYGRPEKMRSLCRKNRVRKIPRFRGGGILGFWGGGGSADFILMGARIFLKISGPTGNRLAGKVRGLKFGASWPPTKPAKKTFFASKCPRPACQDGVFFAWFPCPNRHDKDQLLNGLGPSLLRDFLLLAGISAPKKNLAPAPIPRRPLLPAPPRKPPPSWDFQ